MGVGQEEIRDLVMDWASEGGREASRREFVCLLWTTAPLIQTPRPHPPTLHHPVQVNVC